jgi:type IV pilus assembly protein PilC
MPVFGYKIVNKYGRKAKGVMFAMNQAEAEANLRNSGAEIKTIKEEVEGTKFWNKSYGSVKFKDKIVFLKYLSTILNSGLSLKRALEILSSQVKNRYFSKILFSIREEIEHGQSFHQSLRKYPKVFSPIFVSMIEIGEVSGTLPSVLEYLDNLLTGDYNLRKKVKGAMAYPIMILVFVVVVVLGLIKFIIPRIIKVFENFDFELPFMTRMLIKANDLLNAYWWLMLIILAVTVVAWNLLMGMHGFKKAVHSLYLKIPVIGKLVKQVMAARFTHVTSSLVQSGVTLVESIKITAGTLGNLVFKENLGEAVKYLGSGGELSEYLRQREDLYDSMTIQMISLGETTGNLDQTLATLALLNEQEVEEGLKALTSLIGPLMLVIMGMLIGSIAISIITPIYNLPNLIQSG